MSTHTCHIDHLEFALGVHEENMLILKDALMDRDLVGGPTRHSAYMLSLVKMQRLERLMAIAMASIRYVSTAASKVRVHLEDSEFRKEAVDRGVVKYVQRDGATFVVFSDNLRTLLDTSQDHFLSIS